jgi:hypothetical protein
MSSFALVDNLMAEIEINPVGYFCCSIKMRLGREGDESESGQRRSELSPQRRKVPAIGGIRCPPFSPSM